MTFPAILGATGSLVSALAGLTAAVILAFFDRSLILVAAGGCIAVYAAELVLSVLH